MTASMTTTLPILLALFLMASAASSSASMASSCEPDRLTVYKVVANTFWTKERFPKQFPEWRPPAQWSKLVGRSHDRSFVLFRLSQKATKGVKVFAETGQSDALDAQSQGEGGVYDEFNAPPVTSGAGRTEAEFFVDGNHSRVSLISRMVPSPDWFIGLDSFDLCVGGKWIDSVTIEVDPLDAGTDNGFTFTAPNWATEPQGVIFRITSSVPPHPASSFRYPHLSKLPPIASFHFIKVKEYELSQVFHHSEEDHWEVLQLEHLLHPDDESQDNGDDLLTNELFPEESLPVTPLPRRASSPPTSRAPEVFRIDNRILLDSSEAAAAAAAAVPKKMSKRRKGKKRRNHQRRMRKMRPPRDCRVSEWGPWSMCSQTCGIGEMTRSREVVTHARRGGLPCPPLKDRRWCGSARACAKSYFKW